MFLLDGLAVGESPPTQPREFHAFSGPGFRIGLHGSYPSPTAAHVPASVPEPSSGGSSVPEPSSGGSSVPDSASGGNTRRRLRGKSSVVRRLRGKSSFVMIDLEETEEPTQEQMTDTFHVGGGDMFDPDPFLTIKSDLENMAVIASTWKIPQNDYTRRFINDVNEFLFSLAQVQLYLEGKTVDDTAEVNARHKTIGKKFIELDIFASRFKDDVGGRVLRRPSDGSDPPPPPPPKKRKASTPPESKSKSCESLGLSSPYEKSQLAGTETCNSDFKQAPLCHCGRTESTDIEGSVSDVDLF